MPSEQQNNQEAAPQTEEATQTLPALTDDEIDAKLASVLNPDPAALSNEPAAPDLPDDLPVTISGLASQGRDRLIDTLRGHNARREAAAAETKTPEPTERQLSQTQLEMEAGRRAQAKHEAQMAAVQRVPRERSEGMMTPVHRPTTYVPGFAGLSRR